MNEEWRDIEGYEGLYQVSNLGRVKRLKYNKSKTERLLVFHPNKYGYMKVKLCENGNQKMYAVHRLVAKAFIPNPNNYPIINHKDENKVNNNISNLEWCTVKYNNNYGTRNERMAKSQKGHDCSEDTRVKLSKADKTYLSKRVGQFNKDTMELIATYPSTHEAARQLDINQTHISACCANKPHYKTYKGYVWKYL